MVNNYTTDYKGKVIQIWPKIIKSKDTPNCHVRVQTVLDSVRVEGRGGGISTSRRGIRRDYSNEVSMKYF